MAARDQISTSFRRARRDSSASKVDKGHEKPANKSMIASFSGQASLPSAAQPAPLRRRAAKCSSAQAPKSPSAFFLKPLGIAVVAATALGLACHVTAPSEGRNSISHPASVPLVSRAPIAHGPKISHLHTASIPFTVKTQATPAEATNTTALGWAEIRQCLQSDGRRALPEGRRLLPANDFCKNVRNVFIAVLAYLCAPAECQMFELTAEPDDSTSLPEKHLPQREYHDDLLKFQVVATCLMMIIWLKVLHHAFTGKNASIDKNTKVIAV
eukprot:GHVT01079376.1.p1 GENE.GHVT01079376.1~~GHVT01079376.1.p1  ORF type:complete len:270 (+),score=35.69 GHVT01079376.1:729-1538(+)